MVQSAINTVVYLTPSVPSPGKRMKLFLAHVLFFFSAVVSAETKNYAIFYLDKTASMTSLTADGSSRCQVSKKIARTSIQNFFEKWHGKAIDVRTFAEQGNIISVTQGFTESKAEAMAAIDDSPCEGTSTALADAICDGVDVLREQFASEVGDADSYFLLVAATDGEENSSSGPCGGVDWKSKLESKLKEHANFRLHMNVFGELQKIATDTAHSSSMVNESLRYFARLSQATGGQALFVNDYASELPRFVPLYPNDSRFLAQMKSEAVSTEIWNNPVDAKEIGYAGLSLDKKSYERTLDAIQNIKAGLQDPLDKYQRWPAIEGRGASHSAVGRLNEGAELGSLPSLGARFPLRPYKPGLEIDDSLIRKRPFVDGRDVVEFDGYVRSKGVGKSIYYKPES